MPPPPLDRNRKDRFDSVTRGTTAETEQRNTNSQFFLGSWLRSQQKRVNEQEGLFSNRTIAPGPVELTSRVLTNQVSKAKHRLEQPVSELASEEKVSWRFIICRRAPEKACKLDARCLNNINSA